MNMEEWRSCLKNINMHFHVKEGTRFKNGREKEGASAPRGIEWKSKTILQREDWEKRKKKKKGAAAPLRDL